MAAESPSSPLFDILQMDDVSRHIPVSSPDFAVELKRAMRMPVRFGEPGRWSFQHIFVQKKRNTKVQNYVVANAPDSPLSLAPTEQEKMNFADHDDEVSEALVVGLIDAKDPTKHSTSGSARNKAKLDMIGTLWERPENVLRVVVETTPEYDPNMQVKTLVACIKSGDTFHVRTIPKTNVFYFEEFLPPGAEKMTAIKRDQAVMQRIRWAVARDKRVKQTAKPELSRDSRALTMSKSMVVHRPADLADRYLAQAEALSTSPTIEQVDSLIAMLEGDLKAHPFLTAPGTEYVAAFCDRQYDDNVIDIEAVTKMLQALEATYPDLPKLSPEITFKARQLLRDNDIITPLSENKEVLVLWLKWIHDFFDSVNELESPTAIGALHYILKQALDTKAVRFARKPNQDI